MSAGKAPPRVFYGWIVVGASFLSNIMVLGAGTASFTVFLGPMTRALGWSRTTFTGGVTAQSLLNIAARPVIGIVLDRLRPPSLDGGRSAYCGRLLHVIESGHPTLAVLYPVQLRGGVRAR